MEINLYMDKYKNIRYNLYKWRFETNVVYKFSLALGFALLTAVLAQVKFYLPGNVFVPITGQVFAVLLAGILLGKWGGVSQVMYVGFGAMGLPWFANITGSTIGYLVGFVIAAFFLGYYTDKYIRSRSFFTMLPLMCFATFVLIYIPGLIYLFYYLNSIGMTIGIIELLSLYAIPFIAGDIVKIFAASAVAKAVIPKRSYGNEVDIDKVKNWHIP